MTYISRSNLKVTEIIVRYYRNGTFQPTCHEEDNIQSIRQLCKGADDHETVHLLYTTSPSDETFDVPCYSKNEVTERKVLQKV